MVSEHTRASSASIPNARRRVVIAGGGVAALETLLAVRVHLGERAEITVIAPEDTFLYRPTAVAEAFDRGQVRQLDLPDMLRDQHAVRHVGSLAAVDPHVGVARTAAGSEIAYDELVVAVGARPQRGVPGALPFRGPRDVPAVRAIVDDLECGRTSRIALVATATNAWRLPLYELALMSAAAVADKALEAQILLVTDEDAPLEMFGAAASRAVSELLAEHGVQVTLSTRAVEFADGGLRLADGRVLAADRAICLPRLAGPALEGLPHDVDGFIPGDTHARVSGVDGVYAAGDCTAFPVKQGGLATQQADAAAAMIAQRAGASVVARPFSPIVRGLLLTGGVPLYLRCGLDTPGDARAVIGAVKQDASARSSSWSTGALWWPPSKIAGRYLAPYLVGGRRLPLPSEPLADRSDPEPRLGVVSEHEHADAVALTLLLADADAQRGEYAMALHALDSATSLAGVLPREYEAKRCEWEGRLRARAHGGSAPHERARSTRRARTA